jgi:hypothetical protein
MRVLMATDGSKHATTALVSASRILLTGDREMDLMCVVPVPCGKHRGHLDHFRGRAARVFRLHRKPCALKARVPATSSKPAHHPGL